MVAKQRQEQYGTNELPKAPPVSIWALIIKQLTDFIVLVLLAAAVLEVRTSRCIHSYELTDLLGSAARLHCHGCSTCCRYRERHHRLLARVRKVLPAKSFPRTNRLPLFLGIRRSALSLRCAVLKL